MAQGTAIQWATDTWNYWIGCTKFADECANCYADHLDATRFSKTLGAATKAQPIRHWGKGAPRHLASEESLFAPVKWNKRPFACSECGRTETNGNSYTHWDKANNQPCNGSFERRRAFTGSLMDWADEEVPDSWRDELFSIADQCPQLTFMFLTKRGQSMHRYITQRYGKHGPPRHFWFGMSYMHKRQADVAWLLKTPASVRFLSVEPMLTPVDLQDFVWPLCRSTKAEHDRDHDHGLWCEETRIDQVIFGGESGPNARPCHVDWLRAGVRQCREARVAPFVKQLGSDPRWDLSAVIPESPYDESLDPADIAAWEHNRRNACIPLRDQKGGDMSEWPDALSDIKVRELPQPR